MSVSEATCWTVIRGAAAGRAEDRAEFARRYVSVIRAYLGARWRGSSLVNELEDASQEVFLACFKDDGALQKVELERPFRAFLYGVTRNIARRFEQARGKAGLRLDSEFEVESRERSLSEVFDRAWAGALLKRAAALQVEWAMGDERAMKRVELLRRRFDDEQPIRAIAAEWGVEAAYLHHEYATARREFQDALEAVVRDHQTGSDAEIARECRRLIGLFG